ncbi:hypothetical protein NUACC21_09970 [Scytonema sp. NUACC21]
MLAQFQSKYPQGNLITELVQIHHGKYIVRASVQIEGTTRATGMAAAEILEEAEDRAITRALIVLGITHQPQKSAVTASEPVAQVQPKASLPISNALNESAYSAAVLNSSPQTEVTAPLGASSPSFMGKTDTKVNDKSDRFSAASKQESQFDTKIPDPNDIFATTNKPEAQLDITSQDMSGRFPATKKQETLHGTRDLDTSDFISATDKQESHFDNSLDNLGIVSGSKTENNSSPESSLSSNVTPFPSRSNISQQDVGTQTNTGKRKKKSEPVDLSDVIAQTDVQIQRLGWTKEQGREHLKKTYNKIGRTLLTEEELLDFLRFLESQPTPIDPLAGF